MKHLWSLLQWRDVAVEEDGAVAEGEDVEEADRGDESLKPFLLLFVQEFLLFECNSVFFPFCTLNSFERWCLPCLNHYLGLCINDCFC